MKTASPAQGALLLGRWFLCAFEIAIRPGWFSIRATLKCSMTWWKTGGGKGCSFRFRKCIPSADGDFPTVRLEVDFVAPSRLGEVLMATLSVVRVGASSIQIRIALRGPDGSDRVRGNVVLVLLDLKSNRAIKIPEALRQRIMKYQAASGGPSRYQSGRAARAAGKTIMKFLQPPHWTRPRGYSNGVEAKGRMVFVAGMWVGWDAESSSPPTFRGRCQQALNVIDVLKEADAKPEHIVRMTWYVVDKGEYVRSLKEIGLIYPKVMGWHYPAMSAVQVAALVEDGARVEIEATAVVPE